jgi:transcription elongation GreA/GreB family factor
MSLNEMQEGLSSASESTAGDKHNTSRAMMHLEIEKVQKQIHQLKVHQQTISRISLEKKFSEVGFGSLVSTNNGWLFFSIPVGSVKIQKESIQCVSAVSPIGQALKGKKSGEEVSFQSRSWIVNEIL